MAMRLLLVLGTLAAAAVGQRCDTNTCCCPVNHMTLIQSGSTVTVTTEATGKLCYGLTSMSFSCTLDASQTSCTEFFRSMTKQDGRLYLTLACTGSAVTATCLDSSCTATTSWAGSYMVDRGTTVIFTKEKREEQEEEEEEEERREKEKGKGK